MKKSFHFGLVRVVTAMVVLEQTLLFVSWRSRLAPADVFKIWIEFAVYVVKYLVFGNYGKTRVPMKS